MPPANSPASPPPWPDEAMKIYEPVRQIGKGGFGSVYLAKKRNVTDGEPDVFVAMKMIGGGNKTASKAESGYAKREVDILSELSHPRIVRLIQTFYDKSNDDDTRVPRCIALSLARGPTVEHLLKHGGALGVHMARDVSRQLIDAVAYLHGRAVIHRDIKPDNVIISGARPSDEDCWSDGAEGEAAVREKKWSLTLVDFGFARALQPSEVDVDIGLYNVVTDVKPDISAPYDGTNAALIAAIAAPIDDGSMHNDRGRGRMLDRSMSKRIVRDLSALGNRSYAAPEILQGVRKFQRNLSSSRHGSTHGRDLDGSDSGAVKAKKAKAKRGSGGQKAEPLAECVSDYGMVADAFSLGATIRYMLTGVPPHLAVDDFLAMQKGPLAVASKLMGKLMKKATGKKKKLKKRYRSVEELPPEAARLVHALTHWDHKLRATVRAAKLYPWIAEEEQEEKEEQAMNGDSVTAKGTVQFLKCALPSDELLAGENT